MLYKENWDIAKKRIEAYWNKENQGRCLLQVKGIRGERTPNPRRYNAKLGQALEEFWLDTQKIIERYVNHFENTYFPAESIPYLDVNLGPGVTAAYFGSPVKLYERTIWFGPIISDWENSDIKFAEENSWWIKTKEITAAAVKEGKGKFLTGITDLSGAADIIAHLRGSEELCLDLILHPDKIKETRDRVLKVWLNCYRELYKITQESHQGSINWMGIWAPDMCHSLQCDFSALISPKMFEEYFIPEIQSLCKFLPYSMYHLDGPGAVRHIDLLLDIPELTAVQWKPGDGQPRAVEWIPLLKKIQSAGKCLYVDALPCDVAELIKELSPGKLCINIEEPFKSCSEADDFVKYVESLCS